MRDRWWIGDPWVYFLLRAIPQQAVDGSVRTAKIHIWISKRPLHLGPGWLQQAVYKTRVRAYSSTTIWPALFPKRGGVTTHDNKQSTINNQYANNSSMYILNVYPYQVYIRKLKKTKNVLFVIVTWTAVRCTINTCTVHTSIDKIYFVYIKICATKQTKNQPGLFVFTHPAGY